MLLEGLNEKQKEAVLNIEGPLLILAGAGSGKTKVLTTKIAHMIETGISPHNILAITFTNKAAQEMKTRVFNLVGPVAYNMQISTFHSFGLKIVKENTTKLHYAPNITILDSDDSLTVIKRIMKDKNIDPKMYSPRVIKNKISGAKNEMVLPKEYEKFANNEFEIKVHSIYETYQNKLQISNSVDFDDLLIKPLELFKKHPEVLEQYQEQYKYILIDEYQDTNEAQYLLTKMISKKYQNICVVGDADQSIYSFRGANHRNILNFEKDFKKAKTILLEENYRSTKTILMSANKVIGNNKNRKEKNLWTNKEEGEKVRYKRNYNEKEEANYITDKIGNIVKKNVNLKDIAILYRTNAQSRSIEESFLKKNIPYKVIGSFYFYNRKEIKDLIAYLKIINNPYDDTSLLRIINVPKRGIGAKTIEKIALQANEKNKSLLSSIETGKELEFKKIIDKLIKEKEKLSLTELVEQILVTSRLRDELTSEKTLEADIRIENLEEFKTITKEYEDKIGIIDLNSFLDEISLVTDIEEYKENDNVVTLMTIHASKGLEFDYVFIPGVEEGIFPHMNSFNSNEELEEERRLCYVAITRAKKKLWLLNAKSRMLYGNINQNPASRFISEIGEENLEKDIEASQVFDKNIKTITNIQYTIGEKIIHNIYGTGIIISVENKILTIAFSKKYGIKQIIKGHKSISKI